MSAKWRRYTKFQRRYPISRNPHIEPKDPRVLRNRRTRRGRYRYRRTDPRLLNRRKWRRPKSLIDVFKEEDEIIVVAEIAPFKKENLKIRLEDHELTLSAYNVEGKYHKSLNLPDKVIPESLITSYKNGVLEIRVKRLLQEGTTDKVAA